MTMPADELQPDRALRVGLTASDPVRRAGLTAILSRAGHQIVGSHDDADVVLVDGAFVGDGDSSPPAVTLGAPEAGQAGRLPREAMPAQIDAALRAAAAGLLVRCAGEARAEFRALGDDEPPLLTPRELEVLAAIGDGCSNKVVARRLGISQHTVKFHVESLLRKLGAASRAEAVGKGMRQRLISM
jgi:two-component system, NarL family, nitrate/nitrite response regulator NarL